MLFNPDTRSANFFIPGLMVFLCQMMATMLTANAIVKEKENGTLEQLFMTPVRPAELMIGKLVPYLVLSFVQFLTVATLMRSGFSGADPGKFPVAAGDQLPIRSCGARDRAADLGPREHARRGHADGDG